MVAVLQLPVGYFEPATTSSFFTRKMPLQGAGAKTTRWI